MSKTQHSIDGIQSVYVCECLQCIISGSFMKIVIVKEEAECFLALVDSLQLNLA